MNLYDVIKKPVITEKSMIALEAGKYTFEVDTRAHKLLIKQAVEAAFEGVKVASVNTVTAAVSYTHLDVYKRQGLDTVKICVAYDLDGERIDYYPASLEQLKRCKPIYEELPGWEEDITGCRSFCLLYTSRCV